VPFPLIIGELVVPHAAGLGYVVAADRVAGGGTVVAGQGVEQWLPGVAEGLDVEEQRALIRGMLLQPDPVLIGAACAVALARRPAGIGPYLLSALVHHDLGTLMTPGPDGCSVEERLARAGAELCPLEDERWRGLVLASLRSVAAAVPEARVLARYGTASELREWGPPLLASADVQVRSAFEDQRGRDPEGAVITGLLAP